MGTKSDRRRGHARRQDEPEAAVPVAEEQEQVAPVAEMTGAPAEQAPEIIEMPTEEQAPEIKAEATEKGPGLWQRFVAAMTKERHLPKIQLPKIQLPRLPKWEPIAGVALIAIVLFAIFAVSAVHPRGMVRQQVTRVLSTFAKAEPTTEPVAVVQTTATPAVPASTVRVTVIGTVAPTKTPTPTVAAAAMVTPTVQAVVPVSPTLAFTVTTGITPTATVTPTVVSPVTVAVVGRVLDQNRQRVGGALVAIGDRGSRTFSDGLFELPGIAEAESYTLTIQFAGTSREVVRGPAGMATVPGKRADVGEIQIQAIVPEPVTGPTVPVTATVGITPTVPVTTEPVTTTVPVSPTVVAPTTPVTQTTIVTGTLENAPEELTLLYLVSEDKVVADAAVSDEGTFSFEGVPDGRYDLWTEGLVTPVTVEVKAGEPVGEISLHKVVEGNTLWEMYGGGTWESFEEMAKELGLKCFVNDRGTEDTADDLLVVVIQPGQVFDLNWAPAAPASG